MSDGAGKVVVGISSSLSGPEALRFAIAEARRRQVPLEAVRPWSYNGSVRTPPLRKWERVLANRTRRAIIGTFDEAVGEMPRDLEVLARAAQGVPALTLKDSVESPRDLLVIGTGRRWPAGGVVRGSHGAACPVVVVPRPELARAAGGRMAARQMLREAAEILENSRGFTR